MKTKTLLTVLVLFPVAAVAQTPQVHPISTASAVSTDAFRAVGSVRELPNGKLLVNDILSRRLLLMDSTMHLERVVLDSASTPGSDSYGVRPGALVPYRADTTLFVDPSSYSMQVIDGNGRIVRSRAVWRSEDAQSVASTGMAIGQIGTDGKGRVVYRVMPQMHMPMRSGGGMTAPGIPDSAFIVAADPDTRKIDTLGVIKTPGGQMKVKQDNGRISVSPVINPLPTTDEWAVTADGRVAFVRGRDYRIEYLQADGTMKSSAKLPFDWQRLSDDDKKHVVDSALVVQQKNALNEYATNMIRWVNQTGKEYPADFKIPENFVPTPGLAKDAVLPAGVKLPSNYLYACPPGADSGLPSGFTMGGGPPGGGAPGGGAVVVTRMTAAPMSGDGSGPSPMGCVPAPVMFASGGALPAPTLRTVEMVEPASLPDYRPPFPSGSVRADRDGNLWIRTNPMKPITGGPVFDIVNSDGELVDKIQLPVGYSIVGFGKGKVVYLTSRDESGVHVAKVRLK